MGIDKGAVLSCSLSVTGLAVILASLPMSWYQLDGVNYEFLSGESSHISPDSVMMVLNLARTSFAIGALFAWAFILSSFTGRTRFTVSVGWLSVALLMIGFAHGLSRVTFESNDYILRGGWFVGVLGLVLVFAAAVVEMNKYFAGEKRVLEDEEPF